MYRLQSIQGSVSYTHLDVYKRQDKNRTNRLPRERMKPLMNQNSNLNNNQLEALLKLTAQRLGTTPEALKNAAQNGDLSNVLGNATQNESSAMQKVLSDPDAAKKLLSTPQAQKLMQLFGQQNPNDKK